MRNILEKISRGVGSTKLTLHTIKPDIFIVGGIAGFVATCVVACVETYKLPPVVEKAKKRIEETKEANIPVEKEAKKAMVKAYAGAAKDIALLYAPAICTGVLSANSILYGAGIYKDRIGALAAAYAALDGAYKKYRAKVEETDGKKKENDIAYEDKKDETEDTKKNTTTERSPHAFFYDYPCSGFCDDPETNLMTIKALQNMLQDQLNSRGYLFLNDVYSLFGMPMTRAGQIVGWIQDEDDSVFVDLGAFDPVNERAVMGCESVFLLDPNVQGVILKQFEAKKFRK